MYLLVDENPNCAPEERMFSTTGQAVMVEQVLLRTPSGKETWCHLTAVDAGPAFSTAQGIQVEDSGAGVAWLIYGGAWGVRLKEANNPTAWSLENTTQWGLPFLVLDASGSEIRFQSNESNR